jgi:peptide/nickel transport system substrate-binding protein
LLLRRVPRFARAAGGVAVGAAVLGATAFAATGASERSIRQGGTFRAAIPGGWFTAVDPALVGPEASGLLRPACGSLMAYPHKPLPAGLHLAPELAESAPTVSRDRRAYTFTIRKDARFSTGAPVTARDFEHALERIFDPRVNGVGYYFESIVGARAMAAGKAKRIAGVEARGRTLRLRLIEAVPDLPARLTQLCAVPSSLPEDPEGVRAPIPSAAPYYVAEYVPGESVVLARNRFYRGARRHHVDRITIDLTADAGDLDRVAAGELDYVWPAPDLNGRLPELVQRYGVNKTRFFSAPGLATRMFFLNTARPLFRNNVELRQAVNFAVDREALTHEIGAKVSATATDQILPNAMAGFRDARIYPLAGPNLRKARALARGHTRSGKAVLYTCARPDCVAPAQILKRNLAAIGLEVAIKTFPTGVFFRKAAAPEEPVDILWLGWDASYADPHEFMFLFDGRIPNYSRFQSTAYDRRLDHAARLDGDARYRAYGELDVRLVRDTAPVATYAVLNGWAFVSSRTGCITLNPFLDLTAVCLK